LDEAQQRIKDSSHPWYGRKQLYRADAHKALNALIQGSAARQTKLWMRACWRAGIVPLLQMHDCLDCSVSSCEQAELVARLGEEAVTLDVPMRVDLKYGRSWGDASHSWEELQPAPAKKAIWANRDHDIPVELTTEPAQSASDGRMYQQVIYDEAITYVPQDELRDPAAPAAIVGLLAAPECADLATINSDVDKCAKCRPTSLIIFPEWSTTPRETALSLAAQGVHVFPAPPNTKKSFKSAKFSNGADWGMTNDPKQVARDFRRWPAAGVGPPTGNANGFFVVEADTKEGHDVDGIANFTQLEANHKKLPPTLMARSPSGSLHYYFQHPGDGIEIRNSRSKLAPGVDVRGDGGMVIAPPTRRHDGQYSWCNGDAISESPSWLLDLILANQVAHEPIERDAPIAGDGFDGFDGFAGDPEPIEKIAAALAVLDPRKLGHDEHLKIACALFSTLGDNDGFATLTVWLENYPDFYDPALAKERGKASRARTATLTTSPRCTGSPILRIPTGANTVIRITAAHGRHSRKHRRNTSPPISPQ
jgi:hypothetical protein